MRSDRPPPTTPGDVRVNLITGDSVLIRRNLLYADRTDHFTIRCTEQPVPYLETDLYVIPVQYLTGSEVPADLDWLPVIVYGPIEHLRQASAFGCADFLKEPWSPEELHFRALRVYSGHWFTVQHRELYLGSDYLECDGHRERLSLQERAIIGLLVHHRGTCVPRDVLSYVIRGKPAGESRTIDMHISNVRRKLRSLIGPCGGGAIVSAKGRGYVFTE